MELAKLFSLGAIIFILIVLFFKRKQLLNFSCTAVFFMSYLIFVCVGVFLSPWLMTDNYVVSSYSWINLDLITESDVIVAIGIVLVGLNMFLIGNFIVNIFLVDRFPRRWGGLLAKPANLITKQSSLRLRFLFSFFIVTSSLFLLGELSAAISGLAAFFSTDFAGWYGARYKISDLGRLYFILIFNCLPFTSIALWLQHRFVDSISNKIWAYFAVISTSVFLLLTFQKRPFLIYVICLFFAQLSSGIYLKKIKLVLPAKFPTLRYLLLQPLLQKLLLLFLVVFCVLFIFYRYTIRDAPSSLLITLIFDRILGRLSIMALMYAHYFPLVDPHYNFSNIGMLSSLLGTDLYLDTVVAPNYFNFVSLDEGSGAIGAIYDFYGAFGWLGVILGSFGLGISLNLLDRKLAFLPASYTNTTFYIFMLVFSYNLSQASVPRSLSTYGGAIFIIVWLMLKIRFSYKRSFGLIKHHQYNT